MNCPKCGNVVAERRSRCEVCGKQVTVYRKAYRLSNAYYNSGLEKAKVRDLSGAIIMLKKSLAMNKRNTNARNLLGLVYFEMGETVAALSEWVISKHFQAKDNDADHYMEKIQRNPTKLDAMNQAIKKYNIALDCIKQANDDLAILQLKKVVNLNPHFIRALQLLALIYIKNNEFDRARRCLVKAGKIDLTNTRTLRYTGELNALMNSTSNEKAYSLRDGEATDAASGRVVHPISSYREDKPNVMPYVNLVIGILLGLAVTCILIVPSAKKNIRAEFDREQLDYSSELNVQLANIARLEKEVESLNDDLEEKQAKIDSMDSIEYDKDMYKDLFVAIENYILYKQNSNTSKDELLALAKQIYQINQEKLDDNVAKQLYAKMRDEIYPLVSVDAYNLGRETFDAGNYEVALEQLLDAYHYDPTYDYTLYYLGKTYQELDDGENAVIYYNLLLDSSTNESLREYTTSRLEEISQ